MKAADTTRIIFQNLNGIPHGALYNNVRDTIADFQQHQPDIMAFCEHNLQIGDDNEEDVT